MRENIKAVAVEVQGLTERTSDRAKIMMQLKAQINGEESTNDEGNSDIQCGQDSDNENEPSLKTQLLRDIRRCQEIRKNKQASEKEELKDYYNEEGELSNFEEEMANVNHFEDSELNEVFEENRSRDGPYSPPSPCYSWTTMNHCLTAP